MKTGAQERLEAIRLRIAEACRQAGRDPSALCLVGASKTWSWEELDAFYRLGLHDFGENYVQEAREKQAAAAAAGARELRWHFIGKLQSNKAKLVPGNFGLFHSLHSLALAEKLASAARARGLVQECLLEVNLDREPSKSGFLAEELAPALATLGKLEGLRISGLMCIPAPNPTHPRASFARLRELRERSAGAARDPLDKLSMGMSADFEAAILEGATHVRLGTILFGERARR